MPIWAIHPRPQTGELLSSWLVRIAHESGMPFKEFSQSALFAKPSLPSIDRMPDPAFIQGIAEGTGIELSQIYGMTLLPEEGYVFSLEGDGAKNWVLPAATKITTDNSISAGLTYCPSCYLSDTTPYYRRLWRYYFLPICPTHRQALRDSCPHCNAPYSYQLSLRKDLFLKDHPITHCWRCGDNLAVPQAENLDKALVDSVLDIQDSILNGIRKDSFHVSGYGDLHSRAFLDALHHSMIEALFSSRNREEEEKFLKQISTPIMTPALLKMANESNLHRPEQRAIKLYLTWQLLKEWPDRYISYAKKFLGEAYLFRTTPMPYWFTASVRSSFQNQATDYHCKQEVESAKLVLRKRLGRRETTTELDHLLKTGNILEPNLEKRAKGREVSMRMHQRFSREWEAQRQIEKNKRLAKIIAYHQANQEEMQRNKPSLPQEKNDDD